MSEALACEEMRLPTMKASIGINETQTTELENTASEQLNNPVAGFNVLDLIELFKSDFTDTEKTFAEIALYGQKICVEDLRDTEWAFAALSRKQFVEFLAELPILKRRVIDVLEDVGVPAIWFKEERANKTNYWLLIGQDTALDSPERKRQQAKLRTKANNRPAKERPPEPINGSFEELWEYHCQRVRGVANFLLRQTKSSQIEIGDLTQEIAFSVAQSFEKQGAAVFNKRFLYLIGHSRLVDMLRVMNPGSRRDISVGKLVEHLQDLEMTKPEVMEILQAASGNQNRMLRSHFERVVESVYNGHGVVSTTLSLDALLTLDDGQQMDWPGTDKTDELKSGLLPEELFSQFLDKYLYNPRQSRQRKSVEAIERLKEVMKAIFIDRISQTQLASDLDITPSRVSQLITQEALPILRQNLAAAGVGLADVIEQLEIEYN